MKKFSLLSFVTVALLGFSPNLPGDSQHRSDGYYYPDDSTYDSLGRVPTVRDVQLALEALGYYVGDNRGNFGYETRTAVRRYQRDRGLAITGKIDTAVLSALGLR
jgi:peptidoglycan hydrolase-like protein with peptidoglycan-binding domain